MIRVDNLYRHADGGYYCLLSDDAPLKEPTAVGVWHDGVIYMSSDGRMRSTTKARWLDRFTQITEIKPTDLSEAELDMIRRANPGDRDLDFIRVFESWHESEIGITGHMLELAIGATVHRLLCDPEATPVEMMSRDLLTGKPVVLTITTEDLQGVLQNYEIERTAEPHSFTFKIEKSFPEDA